MSILKIIVIVCVLVLCSCLTDVKGEFPVVHPSAKRNQPTGARESRTGVSAAPTSRQSYGGFIQPNDFGNRPYQNNKRCPLCDSSVYSYCSEKLLHDACCCTDPYEYRLPYQCKLADCTFLHSNTCREHRLIANCCCNDEYRTLLRSAIKR